MFQERLRGSVPRRVPRYSLLGTSEGRNVIKPPMAPADFDRFDTYASIFSEDQGRGAIGVAVSYLDELLSGLLDMAYKQRTQLGNRPTRLKGRIETAHRLGLISDELRADLHVVRELRNRLLHEVVPGSFSEPLVQEAIAGLNTTRIARIAYPNPAFAADYRLQFMVFLQEAMFRINGAKLNLE
jgi:hypothetical protein